MPNPPLLPGQGHDAHNAVRRTPPKLPEHGPLPGMNNRNNNIWLIIGLFLTGVALLAVGVLYFLTDIFKNSYVYDDGLTHERVMRTGVVPEVEEVPALETVITRSEPRAVSGIGSAGKSPMSLDVDIDSDGRVSGTYWNILYDLRFAVSGRELPDGTLDLMLSLDGVNTPLYLATRDNTGYTGYVGKSKKHASNTLSRGSRISETPPDEGYTYHGHIRGNGMSSDFCLSVDDGGHGYYWYPQQGYENRLHVRPLPGSDNILIIEWDGVKLAEISMDTDVEPGARWTGSMVDSNGKRFDITDFY